VAQPRCARDLAGLRLGLGSTHSYGAPQRWSIDLMAYVTAARMRAMSYAARKPLIQKGTFPRKGKATDGPPAIERNAERV